MKILSGGKIFIAVTVGAILLGAGYIRAYGPSPFTEMIDPQILHLEAAASKILVVDAKGKILSPLSLKEFVMIGDQRFEVRPPWRGHRIEGGIDPATLEFAKLPPELVPEGREIYVTVATRDAFVMMAAAAALDGIELLVDSGYRSASYQRRIYQRKMAEGDDFQDIARGVAPPGYSEHMLGTAIDLVPSKWTFNSTPAEKWLLENGAEFDFIQSYPEKSNQGFTWEPWHWKYIGD